MGDSSDDDNDKNYILYKDRNEWRDVTPVPQDDGEEPVVAIDYKPAFKDAYDYFRAILKSGEKSERALELTSTAIDLNPSNYTVWQYRREILRELKKDLHEELKDVELKILKNMTKNYQVWHHRKVLVEWLQDPTSEKEFTKKVLQQDAKNYHAWQHRQWVLKTFNLFDGELDYTNHLISKDIRNNSAWNQRYFVINNTTGFTEDVLKTEIDFTLSNIKICAENESAWNYLRGLLLHDKDGLSKNRNVRIFCEEMYSSGVRSSYLLALIVDMCSEQVGEGESDSVFNFDKGMQLCRDLEKEFDPIRAAYWRNISNMLEEKAKGETTAES